MPRLVSQLREFRSTMTAQKRKVRQPTRVEPQGPLGHLINDALLRRGRLARDKAALLINQAAARDGEPNTSYDRSSLRNWIGRWVVPRADTLRWIGQALDIPLPDLATAATASEDQRSAHATARPGLRRDPASTTGFPYTTPVRRPVPSDDDMQRRNFLIGLVGLASSADLLVRSTQLPRADLNRMDEAFLHAMRTAIDTYTTHAHAIPPRQLLPIVQTHSAYLQRHAPSVTSPELRTELHALASQTAILAGRLHYRLDDWANAQGYYAFSQALADHVGNPELRATAILLQSYLCSAIPHRTPKADTLTAIALLDEAEAVGHLSRLLQVWICARRAEEYASIRDRRSAFSNLDRAARVLNDTTTAVHGSSGLLSTWSPARLAGYRGNCLLLLGDTATAVKVLRESLLATTPTLLAERLAVLTDLAAATASDGNTDEACLLLIDALTQAEGHGLLSSAHRIVGTRRRYLPANANLQALHDLDERISRMPYPVVQ
jgi:tetratricopeptide (TPR) repeat protein